MALKKIRPGLYERTDTPKQVRITRKFADAVREEGKSTLLEQLVEQAVREDDERSSGSHK
jgi:hypothetical protein